MSAAEERWLSALQQGLPLVARPFEALARELDCTEDDLLAFAARCRAKGLVRRFGAVFDTRRLGYRSVLCAAAVAPRDLDAVAGRLLPLVGVTHCYVREPLGAPAPALPNLWFTLSYPADVFPAMADEVRARVAPCRLHLLPATVRYKVDVVFGAGARAREESTADGAPVSARDRIVIGALQGDTEIRADYFAALAGKTGLKEWQLLSTLELWRRNGRLKRIGLLLAHRTAGWTANGMCCWKVAGDTHEAGRALAARDEVTHCYERPEIPEFPYNLFAMVHARSVDDALGQYRSLSETLASTRAGDGIPSVMLLSTKEYKKTSMTFFADAARSAATR
ncbi:MAG: hypothetical protein ACI4Q3_05790 [Kiritimatiellia bacterium]